MKKAKIIKLLISILIIVLGIIGVRQLNKTISTNYVREKALAVGENIKNNLCLEVEGEAVLNPLKGDMNKDGYITKADANYLLRYASRIETENLDTTLMDLNNDGVINSKDARIVLRLAEYINDYRNYMSNKPEEIDLQDMITYIGEDYLFNCNTLLKGNSITIVPNFELSEKSSITNKNITAQSSNTDVATVEIINNTKVKITGVGVGDVQIIVTSVEEPSTMGIINLRVMSKMNLIGTETVSNYKRGDINKDGIITEYDGVLLLRYVAGLNNELDELELDINKDGKIKASDAREILRLANYLKDEGTLNEEELRIWRKKCKRSI